MIEEKGRQIIEGMEKYLVEQSEVIVFAINKQKESFAKELLLQYCRDNQKNRESSEIKNSDHWPRTFII